MARYTVLLHEDVFQATPRGRSRVERFKAFLRHLAEFPHAAGDRTITDAKGRLREIKRIGEMEIIYWSDHAEKQVQILAVEIRASKRPR